MKTSKNMEMLAKILGSSARVKIMRLFLRGKGSYFTSREVSKRSKVDPSVTRREIKNLYSAGFLKKRASSWSLNPSFYYLEQLEDLLIRAGEIEKKTIYEAFKKAGRIKLLIASGLFIKDKDSRVDLLIVGDRIKSREIEKGIKKMEAETGSELAYVVFDTKEFAYRLDMYDKLVRDILDFPHEVVFSSKRLSTKLLKEA